jgi:hypothetical protein
MSFAAPYFCIPVSGPYSRTAAGRQLRNRFWRRGGGGARGEGAMTSAFIVSRKQLFAGRKNKDVRNLIYFALNLVWFSSSLPLFRKF